MGIKLNLPNIQRLDAGAQRALIKTADAIKTDIERQRIMPFDTGALQNRSTFIDDRKAAHGKVSIVNDTPYARRLYFHPEYAFDLTENPNACAYWFDDYYEGGAKQEYAKKLFAKFMRKEVGGG
jgi:hypothetical protein